MIYGYARVSTRAQESGNSLESQENELRQNGAQIIIKETFTGARADRPNFQAMLSQIQSGDTLIITKLDRFARSLSQGSAVVTELIERGIKVHILNIGVMDNTPASKLIRNIFFSFAEFERDIIYERTTEGKEIARTKPGYKEGRPRSFSPEQIEHAVGLLTTHSYKQVERMTGISKSTLIRAVRKRKI